MDPDSPMSRAGRTFLTFWNYITETVSRFFRPEPPVTEINDQNTTHDASINNEHHTDDGGSQGGEEESHVAPVSSLSLSGLDVFRDTGSELETGHVDKMCKDGDCVGEEEVVDVANLSITDNPTSDTQEECSDPKVDVNDVMVRTDANICSLPDESLNVVMKGSNLNIWEVEEPDGTITLDDQQSLDQFNEMNKEGFNELNSFLGSETEDISKLDIKTAHKEHSELQDEKKDLPSDDMAVIQGNQGLEGHSSLIFPETLPHVEFIMADELCSIVSEGEPRVDIQEHTVPDGSDESASDSDKEEKSSAKLDPEEQETNLLDGKQSEMAQENEDIVTKNITCNTYAAPEDGVQDNATDLCLPTQKFDLDFEGVFDIKSHNDNNMTRPSSEKESGMEKFCLSTLVTVDCEGKSRQEEAKAFKNMPPAQCEGQDSASQALYSSNKEGQDGVPEHNNETGFDRSATQRFLEVGNCREVQTTLLQEEVEESGDAQRLRNSSSEAGADSFEEAELMETEPNKNSSEVDNDGSLTEKTITVQSDVLNTMVDDKIFRAPEKDEHLKEETKEILVEFEMGESLCEAENAADGENASETAIVAGLTEDKFYETEFQMTNETMFLDQSTDENDLCKMLVQKESNDESLLEMQYTGIHLKGMEEDLCTIEEEPEKTISESNSEKYEVQLGFPVEDDKAMSSEDKLLNVDCEILPSMLSAEESMKEICQTHMLDQLMCSEVIEDEILDLWIQQTSLENTDVKGGHEEEERFSELAQEEQVESNPELSSNISSSTAESGFFDQFLDVGGLHQCKKQEEETAKIQQLTNLSSTLSELENTCEFSMIESELETPWKDDLLSKHVRSSLYVSPENTEDEAEEPLSSTVMKDESKFANNEPLKRTLFEVEAMTNDLLDSSVETDKTVMMSDTPEICQLPLQEKPKKEVLSWFNRKEGKYIDELDASELNFTPQKSRIAVKNPRVRPPKDPRSLLHKPSLEPSPLKHQPSHVPAGVPLRGLGIAVKLPGLGAGFPVLKKKSVEGETETATKETEPGEADKPKEEDSQHKPKWLPPQHPAPGFGNPLMSELKSKLKKTAKE